MSLIDTKLAIIVKKYATHPEFLGIDVVAVNQPGAVDDTLLHLATGDGATDDVIALLQCGADANSIGDLGNTPLHTAALMGQLACAEILLSHGANLEIRNEFGETAMNIAELIDCSDMVFLLRKNEPHSSRTNTSAEAMASEVANGNENILANSLARERWMEYRDLKKSGYEDL